MTSIDGTTSDDPNPTHRFGEEGEWQVTLDVVAEDGLTSKAEGAVGIERGSDNSGEGAIGLNDMADKVVATVERAAKGSVVVVLVIGLFIVLAIVGGPLVSNGVRMLRPVPKRINVKLRPKELELAVLEAKPEIVDTKGIPPIVLAANDVESTDVLEPV